MRLIKISPGKFAAASGVVPDVILDQNRANRVIFVSDAEFAAIALSGVMADELTELAEQLTLATGVLSSSPTLGFGYDTGAGGAVTQITNSATGVTLSKPCGQITTVALTTAAGAEEKFTVTNTLVDANDVIAVCTTYAGQGQPMCGVSKVTAGAFDIDITNVSASALNALMIINFVLIKSVVA